MNLPTIPKNIFASALLALLCFLYFGTANALPLFSRQTGQNCVACHAGGQYPELTPYGRYFKMTGYTIGQRTDIPVSVQFVGGLSLIHI